MGVTDRFISFFQKKIGCVEGAMSCNVHVGVVDHSDLTNTPSLRNAVTRKCQVLRSLSLQFLLEPRNVVFKLSAQVRENVRCQACGVYT